MEEEDAQHAVPIDTSKTEGLSFRQGYESENQCQKQQQHTCRPQEALFLTYCTEDEVGILFRHKLQFCLCTIQKALSLQSTGANGYLTLVYIIAGPSQVFLQSQQHIDTRTLVGLHHIIEDEVGTIRETDGTQHK